MTVLLWAVGVHEIDDRDLVHDCIQAGTTAAQCRSESHVAAVFHVLVVVLIGLVGIVALLLIWAVTARQRPPGRRHGVDPPFPRD